MARRIRKVDPAYLERVALWYLERWSAPPAGLRRILMKRVHRSVRAHDTDLEEATAWVDDVVARAEQAGLVSDAAFAEATVRRWRASGKSERAIRSGLRAKGVAPDAIDHALSADAEDTEGDPERLAALRYARRRRFGPWRRDPADDDRRRKELASLARQGFSYPTARDVLSLTEHDREAAEDELLAARW